ncbi:LAFA_0D08856g1_1 [Lachancea sp. 'fantastica']|nr:LAFA_0D08856g1_1 [Lachancea sp. 'fantastica']
MQGENRFNVLSGGTDDPNIDRHLALQITRVSELSTADIFDLKTRIENKLDDLFKRLETQGADLESNLVTPEGFPRSDIDVLQVRLLRRSINMLRNDLRVVINRAQELMASHFQKLDAKTQRVENDSAFEFRIPFALVTEVISGSPSEKAGLLHHDKLVRFGNIHAGNNQMLSALGLVAKNNEDKALAVRVLRGDSLLDLTLTPSIKWAGNGLLGCRLVHI